MPLDFFKMKNILYYLIISIGLIGSLSSCISSEETNYLQDIKAAYPLKQYEEYKLAVGDMIYCNIASRDKKMVEMFSSIIAESSGSSQAKTFIVNEDGTVILPFFGSVKIVGMTIQQAEQAIQKMMQESITDTQVKVTLANNFFYVMSKDKGGQHVVYKDNMTIYQALAISEQTTQTMDLSKVSIMRIDANGKTVTKTFDLRSNDVIQSEYYYIQPNDLIYFPTNKNTFYNVTNLATFLTTILTPLSFLFFAATYSY